MPHEGGQFAPVQLSEQENEAQRTAETFRGPEFGEELDRSRNLSENFPSEILDFLAPLLIPQQRASARGRENLIDSFRRTGGLKSSFAGQRFQEFERDASLNEILGLVTGAKSFFGPLAALQQNRLTAAGTPLSRSQQTSSGSGSTFGFEPEDLRGESRGGIVNSGGTRPTSSFSPESQRVRDASFNNPLSPFGPSFKEQEDRGIFFNPATGLSESIS